MPQNDTTCSESTFHSTPFKNSLKYTWVSVRGSRAPPGCPDRTRVPARLPLWLLTARMGCPSHPRYWTATDGLDPVAQIRLCRSAPSPTASSLHLVFSRVSAWGVPPFLDGKESTPATMAATDSKSTGALATAAGGATELRVWPGLSGGQISSLNSILLA